jgi:hypothetical protein
MGRDSRAVVASWKRGEDLDVESISESFPSRQHAIQAKVDVGEYSPFFRQMTSAVSCVTGQPIFWISQPRQAKGK